MHDPSGSQSVATGAPRSGGGRAGSVGSVHCSTGCQAADCGRTGASPLGREWGTVGEVAFGKVQVQVSGGHLGRHGVEREAYIGVSCGMTSVCGWNTSWVTGHRRWHDPEDGA